MKGEDGLDSQPLAVTLEGQSAVTGRCLRKGALRRKNTVCHSQSQSFKCLAVDCQVLPLPVSTLWPSVVLLAMISVFMAPTEILSQWSFNVKGLCVSVN